MVNNDTLREKVYNYLRDELAKGVLEPGTFIDQKAICNNLNISRAPLRDALIQLDAEGFIQILPRRGVLIKTITLADIQHSYEIIGALESSVVRSEFHQFTPVHIDRLEKINKELKESLDEKRFDTYYKLNLAFHGVFIAFSGNRLLDSILSPLKQRLYDFPRMDYDHQWELINLREHQRFIDSIKVGNCEAAAAIIKYEHWSFDHHKDNLVKIYRLG